MAAAGFKNISTLPQTDILGPSRTPLSWQFYQVA